MKACTLVGFNNVIIPYVAGRAHAGTSSFSLRSLSKLRFTATRVHERPLRL